MSIETIFNGHTIKFDEDRNMWRCYELDLRSDNLKELQRKITKHGDAESAFVRVNVFLDRYGEIKPAVVTSITGNGEYWVVCDGKRSKTRLHYLNVDNPENRERVNKIAELAKQIAELSNEIDKIKNELEPWKP
jgi:hypothetical protein